MPKRSLGGFAKEERKARLEVDDLDGHVLPPLLAAGAGVTGADPNERSISTGASTGTSVSGRACWLRREIFQAALLFWASDSPLTGTVWTRIVKWAGSRDGKGTVILLASPRTSFPTVRINVLRSTCTTSVTLAMSANPELRTVVVIDVGRAILLARAILGWS